MQQRGTRLHQALLFDGPTTTADEVEYNGRSPILVANRNRLIAVRYYFYTRMVRRNFPDTYNALEAEFFLSQIQLTRIVASFTEELLSLKKNPPTTKQLAAEYPFFVWSLN